MLRKLLLCFAYSLLCFSVVPLNAQEEITPFDEHPLFQMLSVIPDNEVSRADITYYQILRTVEYAADYVHTYNNVENRVADDLDVGFTLRWSSLPSRMRNDRLFSRGIERMPEFMGFDFFDIDYTLEVGVPPYTTMVLRGNFDMDSVVAAHVARDYIETEMSGVQVMSGLYTVQ